MTYSNTYSSPSSPTNFNPFSGMGMRKGGRPSLFPGSGDGSTLSLDFTTGVLDPRLTFRRAGGGTYVGSDGYIYGVDSATSASLAIGTGSKSVTLTATAGVDRRFQVGQTVYFSSGANNMSGLVTAYNASTQVITINATATTGSGSFTSWFVGNASPRFDYSPTNIGEPRGLLVEGQGINLCTYSQDFAHPDWTKDSSVGSTNADVSTVSADTPANGTSVNQIVFNRIATGYSRVTRSTVGTVTTPYTMSVWMRTVSGTANVGLRIGADSVGFKCAVTTTWKRFQYTYTLVGLSTDANAQIMLWNNIVGTDLTATVYVWGCQVELGSGASSLIPTGASQVTRNADLLAVTSTTTMGLNTSEGTFFVETELPRAGITSPAQFGTPYANGSWLGQFYGGTEATTLTANWWGGSVLPLSRSGNPKSLTALSYGLYTGTSIPVSSSLNGAVSTGTFTTSGANNAPNPATWSFITLACNATGSSLGTTSRDNFNGCIKRFKYYPSRLSNAELQALTAP